MHEKVETILVEEEELLDMHVEALKEDARILTEEGELIAMAQGSGEYDLDTYVGKLEQLTRRKLALYQGLFQKLTTFKSQLREEEQVSHHLSRNLNNLR